jgi:hypothetical protein
MLTNSPEANSGPTATVQALKPKSENNDFCVQRHIKFIAKRSINVLAQLH